MKEEKRPSIIACLKRDITNLLKLNLIFIVCSLPLVSIPAAVQAMTRVNLALQKEENVDVISDFLHAFRESFIDATISGLMFAVLFLVFGYVAWFYQNTAAGGNLLTILFRYASLLPLILLYCATCYLWCLNEMVLQPRLERMKNAVRLTIICIRPTLLCLLTGTVLGSIVFLGVPYSTPFLFVGAFSVWNYIATWYASPMVDIYILGNSPNSL